MNINFKKYPLTGIYISLIILVFTACRKPDAVLPEGPKSINVEATVPVLIYSNIKRVYLDASRTRSLNSSRELFFNWSCTSFPAASGKPDIKNANEPAAWIENPGIGQYKLQLSVKDNLGNIAELIYTLDVLEDTLLAKKPIAKAGPDQQIYVPRNQVQLDAYQSYYFNPIGRALFFKWTVIEKPAANSPVTISNNTITITNVNELTEGFYKIQLEVKNEIGLSAFDTIEIKVLPDRLKGTALVFENELWENLDGPFDYIVAIVIDDPDLFFNRSEDNMEVRIWDEEKKDWADPKKFEWTISEGGRLLIFYPYLDDIDTYYKMAGTKTRVQVKFL